MESLLGSRLCSPAERAGQLGAAGPGTAHSEPGQPLPHSSVEKWCRGDGGLGKKELSVFFPEVPLPINFVIFLRFIN